MTLREAEEIYKSCFGNEGRYVWHEIGPEAYREYCDLKISRETKAKWDRDLLELYLNAIRNSPDYAASWVNHVLEALVRGNCETDEYARRLLDELERAPKLNDLNRINVIRYMGEDSRFHVSGCQFYCLRTPYADRMDAIMQRMMDFECPDEKADPRFERSPSKKKLYQEAVDLYRKAYARWHNQGR